MTRRGTDILARARSREDTIVMASAASRGDTVFTSDVDDFERLRAYFPGVRVLSAGP
jgi:predicted nucleic acid-binding protein